MPALILLVPLFAAYADLKPVKHVPVAPLVLDVRAEPSAFGEGSVFGVTYDK